MVSDDVKGWLKAIIDFPGTGSEAREHAQVLYDLLAQPGSGVELIAAERVRQVEAKGFTADHDDTHVKGEIAAAAAALALYGTDCDGVHGTFPGKNWHGDKSKPKEHPVPFTETWMQDLVDTCRHKTDLRRLVIAGAMIAAEIDRLMRAAVVRSQHQAAVDTVKDWR